MSIVHEIEDTKFYASPMPNGRFAWRWECDGEVLAKSDNRGKGYRSASYARRSAMLFVGDLYYTLGADGLTYKIFRADFIKRAEKMGVTGVWAELLDALRDQLAARSEMAAVSP